MAVRNRRTRAQKPTTGKPEASKPTPVTKPAADAKNEQAPSSASPTPEQRAAATNPTVADVERIDVEPVVMKDDNARFSSLLERDTTHFDNVHHAVPEELTVIGSRSSRVRVTALQAMLLAAGEQVEVDGQFNETTKQAVASYRRRNNMSGDVIDRKFINHLSRHLIG